MRKVLVTLGVMIGALGPGCGGPDKKVEYDPYAGPAVYPDKRPKLPAPKGYFGYVSDSGSDTITVLDLPGNEVVMQVRVGRDPVAVDGPHHLAVDSAGNVYVALSYPAPLALPGPHASHASSSRFGFVQKLAPDDLHVVGEVQIDPNPGEIVLSADGTKIVVTQFDLARAQNAKLSADDQKATLMVIDPASLVLAGSPTPKSMKVCRAPHGVSFAHDNHTVFVACYADDTLAIVDVTTLAPPKIVTLGCKGPYSAVLSPTGQSVAVGCTDSKDTHVVDTAAPETGNKAFITQGAPYFAAWAADESKLWIPTQVPDALVLVDATTKAVIKQRVFDATTCIKPHEAILAKDGTTLYLVCEGDHVKPSSVLALDPATLDTKSTLAVGVYPDRLALQRRP